MPRSRFNLVCTLALLLTIAAAPKSKASPKAETVPDAIASLVPTKTAALIYVKSPARLQERLRQLVGRFDKNAAQEMDLTQMVGSMLQGAAEQWDMSKPMAVALPLPDEGQDLDQAMSGMSLIFGMKDAQAGKAAFDKAMAAEMADTPEEYRPPASELPSASISGDYLMVTQRPDVARGGSPLAATVPAADVSLRIDLAALVARFGKEIQEGLAKAEELAQSGPGGGPQGPMPFGDMFGDIKGKLLEFIQAAELLEVGVSVDEKDVEFALGFTAKQGSALDRSAHAHSGLKNLAALLPEGSPLYLLLSYDGAEMMKLFAPLMEKMAETLPEEQRAGWKSYMAEMTEMSALLGPNYAMSLDMGGGKGMQVAYVADAKDAATYMQRMDKMFQGEAMKSFGITAVAPTTSTVAGIEVKSYAMRMDMQAMMAAQGQADLAPEVTEMMGTMMEGLFGSDAMHWHVARVENRLVCFMGDPARLAAVIEAARGGGKVPAALASGIQRAGASPVFVLSADLRQFLRQVLAMAADIMEAGNADRPLPQVPAGGPVPVTVWGMHDGRVYGGGLRLDAAGLAELIESMGK